MTAHATKPEPFAPGQRLDTLLGPRGPLAAQLPGFAHRPQQVALARAVETALAEGRPCLAEAGTGVGKTLAYLVPLVRWLDRHGGRAVVSTHTLALQAQLGERDIPTLLQALPKLDIRAVVLKGRGNFLCLQDLDVARGELWTQGDPQFKQIQRWSNETETGDVAELDFAFPGWADIAANVDTCRQRDCRFWERCFYFKARKGAEDANLLVVNHALFFADLRLRRSSPGGPTLLPSYDAVVFDEAHHVEEMATRAFGLEFGSRRVPQLVAKARRVLEGGDTGLLASVEALSQQLFDPFLVAPRPEAFVDEAVSSPADRGVFADQVNDLSIGLGALAKELAAAGENANDAVVRDRAAGLARTAARLATEVREVTAEDAPALTPASGHPSPNLGEREETASSFTPSPRGGKGTHRVGEGGWGVRAGSGGHFRWYHTRRARGGQAFSTLVKTPLAVDAALQNVLFEDTPRVVFTSATLASGRSFAYLKTRLGLGAEDAEPPVEVIEGSPFDYQADCLLYIPRHLGTPVGGQSADQGGYVERVSDEVLALVEAARGRTFALFTSHRMLQAVRERLWDQTDYPLFTQGEMPNARLVEAFAQAGNGVLLGTSSFWEGVDVPGPALSCVILDKLPFAAPDSPTQRARENAIRAEGGDAFRQLSLPQAQLRLKQGFGRLLRSASDRGVVCILDGRLYTKSYGRDFLADLPPCPRTDRIEDVEHFFHAPGLTPASKGATT